MSDRSLWTREHDATLRCDEPLRRVVASPDDTYLACHTRHPGTVVVVHAATAETLAVLHGLPVADVAWCGPERLAILRQSSVAFSLYVHEFPDGGEATAHIFERPGAGVPTLRAVPETQTAVVAYLDDAAQNADASRRVEVFSGPRLEGRRVVDLRGIPDANTGSRRRLRSVTMHPHGDSMVLYLASPHDPDHLALTSLIDGTTTACDAWLPDGAVRWDWRSPTEVLVGVPYRAMQVFTRLDLTTPRATQRELHAMVLSTDLHPDRDQMLVALAQPTQSRLEFEVAVLSVDDDAAEPTAWWRYPIGAVRFIHAAWDHRGAVIAAVCRRNAVQIERWSGINAQPEAICTLEHLGGNHRALRLHPTPTRRHFLLTVPHGESRPDAPLVRASLITV